MFGLGGRTVTKASGNHFQGEMELVQQQPGIEMTAFVEGEVFLYLADVFQFLQVGVTLLVAYRR
jgi:hypothetical protein